MTNNKFQIREASRQDVDAIAAFQQAMAQETEGKALNDALLRQGVGAIFDSSDKGFYLVAEADGQVVGSLLITYEWSDWRNANFWWIQSVYVTSDWRRRGVYRAMYDHIYRIADSRDDICGIRLYVEHNNTIAQQTYQNLGMSESHYYLYEVDFVL